MQSPFGKNQSRFTDNRPFSNWKEERDKKKEKLLPLRHLSRRECIVGEEELHGAQAGVRLRA